MKKTFITLLTLLVTFTCINTVCLAADKSQQILLKEGAKYYETCFETGKTGIASSKNPYLDICDDKKDSYKVYIDGYVLFSSDGKILTKFYKKNSNLTDFDIKEHLQQFDNKEKLMVHIYNESGALGWSRYSQNFGILSTVRIY